MTDIIRTYHAYDIEDVERNVSRVLGRDVKISEMDVLVADVVYMDGIAITVTVGGVEAYIDEDHENGDPFGDLDCPPCTEDWYIFNFDVRLFKSYLREVCLDD